MIITRFFLALGAVCVSTTLFSQKEYEFASTGQQKLLLNPALAGSTKGVDVQTLYGRHEYFNSYYTGISYNGKKFGFAISNTNYASAPHNRELSNQADLGISYNIKLGRKVTLIPALQVSFIEKKQYYTNLEFLNPRIDYILPDNTGNAQTKRSTVVSPGVLLDINKKITFGAAFYNINQPDMGLNYQEPIYFSQVYHISIVLFKENTISLQPYSIVKLQNIHQYYYETGAYATYRKTFTLHTAIKKAFYWKYVRDYTFDRDFYLVAGMSFNYKKIKLGYTLIACSGSETLMQELFLSANLFAKHQKQTYNLVVN